MKDGDRTKEQLIAELAEIRQRTKILESERQRLALILDEIPAQVYLIAPDREVRYSNRFFQERFGKPEGKPCYMVFNGRTEPCEECTTFKIGENIRCEQGEYVYQDGNTYQNYDYPFTDVDGTEVLLSLGLDITLQKKAEAALLQSEEKFSKAFHCNPDLMAISTLKEGRYVEVNDAFINISGYERHEVIGCTAHELEIWADYSQRELLLKQIQENGTIKDFELELRRKSGEIRNFCLSGEIIDIDGEPHLLNSSRDITESKEMEEALRLSEECFSQAFNASPVSMTISILENGRLIKVNNAFSSIMGISREEAIGKSSLELGFWSDPVDRNLVIQKLLANQSVQEMEIGFCKNTGEQCLGLYSAKRLDVNGEPCILSILMDITELRKMEVEMTRLDRLNLVGEMAASIGHEIRNPMTTVRGYLQLLQQNDLYHDEIEYFDLMIEELDRANSIITEFLSLAKNKLVQFMPHKLNSVLKNILPLVQATATFQDKIIKLELEKLPDLLVDKKEIQQLVLNLVNNGLESMSDGGCLTIRTFLDDDNVVLAVQDEGHGVDRELLDKLGTPFFTTKDYGTGLGLAICYRIANRHNAKIDIETSPTGTTFYVRFPRPIDA